MGRSLSQEVENEMRRRWDGDEKYGSGSSSLKSGDITVQSEDMSPHARKRNLDAPASNS